MKKFFRSSIKVASRASMLPDPPSNFRVSECLSEELLKMSFDDRKQVEEEIHGVECRAVAESPELIQDSLAGFDSIVNDTKESDASKKELLRNVIRISQEETNAVPSPKSKCYLNDPDVRLRFLRSERFVVDKSVERFINFLEFMSELFGDFISERPPELSDFNEEEEDALMHSRCQILPFRDRSGRRVSVYVGNCNFHLGDKLRNKILMYLYWVISEDVETQQKGMVSAFYIFDEDEDHTWEKALRPKLRKSNGEYSKKQSDSMPIRKASVQLYCKDTPFFRILGAMHLYTVDPNIRPFYKQYYGEQTEILYKMATYGLPVDLFPVSSTGQVKYSQHMAWLKLVRSKTNDPKEMGDRELVECPRSNDVVIRSGATAKNNPGNAYYRELIEYYSDEHLNANKRRKIEITMLIGKDIERRGGRFLEWVNKSDVWSVISNRDTIRKKVAAAIKQHNRPRMGKSQKQQKSIGKTRRLSEAINDAAAISSDDEYLSEALPDPVAINELQNYFFVEHRAKRQRNHSFTSEGEDDNACFGKFFFPLE